MSSSAKDQLRERIEERTARIGVVGLGYVGLPLAEAFVAEGFTVLGFDKDTNKIDQLKSGQSYIRHISSDRVGAMMADSRFKPTTDPLQFAEADAIIICVPTPLTDNREPDLSYIVEAGQNIAPYLRPGQLVVLESTTYPGTTEDLLLPILEQSGLHAGSDFYLAYSPEREDPGNADYGTRQIPKVVGGHDPLSRELAVQLYRTIVTKVVPVTNTRVAEACKILENTYRAVNIALVNELKIVFDAMGIDIWEVIDAAKTKPFGYQAFYPGPGLGGHCIPIDPFYLTWAARKYKMSTRFVELAGEINTRMPAYVVERVAAALNEAGKAIKGSNIVVLGVAYKKDVDDCRESPGLAILQMLEQRGAAVSYNDPLIPALPGAQRRSQPLTDLFLNKQDCVVIATNHSYYDWERIAEKTKLIVDTRNAMDGIRETACRIWKA